MSALRTSLRRMPISSALRSSTSTTPFARSLSTLPARPLASVPSKYTGLGAFRSLNSTPPAQLEPSAPVADGGATDPPESGINVDKSTRMDTLVLSLCQVKGSAKCAGEELLGGVEARKGGANYASGFRRKRAFLDGA
ncbi:uncharacterized protein MKK02DRAFT_42470 [Dioszegia hungarica]|uniref:Uncharacterized protein n=1 Tax=Dioszegia hungarica TaxID=4972 RepID=A0AA38LWN1_9TREE|nr:uncharacterized protein MKK02DRAFT_42470 [Dioszegia hungarica]KAI9638083.1 hypothetical protein MKK02DRAFT_42470 [Dioszegia hungarica]